MTLEQTAFLGILSDFVRGIPSVKFSKELDWDVLLEMAKKHNLKGIIYIQCKEYLTDHPEYSSYLKNLRHGFVSEVCLYACRTQDLKEVEKSFTENNIPFLVMKGLVFAGYYPDPHLRTMGDTDILIRVEDREKSHQVMIEEGYIYDSMSCGAVWNYDRDLTHYELHDHMIYDSLANEVDYETYFSRAWDYAKPIDGSKKYELDETFHFVYLIAHTAKHILNRGSGFRPFLDMAFMIQKAGKRLDWKWIEKQLHELRLEEFSDICLALCNRWFGVKLPLRIKKMDEAFYQEVTEKVFIDGIFGFANSENEIAGFAKKVHREQLPYWMTSVKMTFRLLFPSYNNMRLIPYYNFVDGKPYLLPIAWLYRFIYCVYHKFGESISKLANPYLKRKKIKERDENITILGL